ncbi:uncharacterized protein LOC131611047 [Vicia villosa]|uniref:uncharacterized protein LOC131611047 n=1 Tax=Vicia villosa TaxID=3911 RepID=UPI00273C5BC7|nr:uncharacterized protein LOC131611047 [Vicia villosa]
MTQVFGGEIRCSEVEGARLEGGAVWSPAVIFGSEDTTLLVASSAVLGAQWQWLLLLLAAVRFSSSAEDSFEWLSNLSGLFTVASTACLTAARKSSAWQPQVLRRLKIMWNLSLPFRIQIFVWRFFTSRIPTIDALIYRGVENISCPSCVFCGNEPKSLYHTFFSCNVSLKVWEKIYGWLGEDVLFSFEEFLEFDAIQEKMKGVAVKVKINSIWMALIWSVWIMRNSIVFDQASLCFFHGVG